MTEQKRLFPTMSASDDIVIVTPDALERAESIIRLRDTLAACGGKHADVVSSSDFFDEIYEGAHIIACGNMSDNRVLERLYTMRRAFTDSFFPGPDGFFIKSVSDPFGYGNNILVAGASDEKDTIRAINALESLTRESGGELTRVHRSRFSFELPPFPDEEKIPEIIRADLATWTGGWSSSPFRGGQIFRCLWYYYLTDHPAWGQVIPPICAGSIEPWLTERKTQPESYHTFFNLHSFIHLWDLVEDSPLFTDEDRGHVVTLLCHLLDHLAGLFYLRPDVNPPGEPRQNHSTFIALNLAVGHDYLVRRYGLRRYEPAMEAARRIFDGQADSYKPNDDAGVGYAWHVPKETLSYYLYHNDYRYVDAGPLADLCRLAVVTTDNMRSEVSYGDASGYSAFSRETWNLHLWPLMVSTWRARDPQSLWTLNWLGEGKRPPLDQAFAGLYSAVRHTGAGFTLEGVEAVPPDNLLGIHVMDLAPSARRWVTARTPPVHRPDTGRRYFDKISLRPSFDPQDEYVLLEGVGTFCHGHEDTAAIVRLTWNNRVWLADGDYILAAPKYHSMVVVTRDGVGVLDAPGEGVVIPPLASVRSLGQRGQDGRVMVETTGYNGTDWRRGLFWKKNRYILVMDQIISRTRGHYDLRCVWRLVGEVEQDGATTYLSQQGEWFFIRNADVSDSTIIPDKYDTSDWKTYPHADPKIRSLHQTAPCDLDAGADYGFVNLLTPHPDIRVERLNDHAVKIQDGDDTTVVGVGTFTIGAITFESSIAAITVHTDSLSVQGVARMGIPEQGGALQWEVFDEQAERALDFHHPVARHLRAVIKAARGRSRFRRRERHARLTGGMALEWSEPFEEDITAIAVGDAILCGTSSGRVIRKDADSGATLWENRLDHAVSAVCLMDGTPWSGEYGNTPAGSVAVGTTQSTLSVLDGRNGNALWTRALKNISGRGEKVVDIAVADLYGDGRRHLLAATAGWYVNAYTLEGEPLWDTWIRYHVITRLNVLDADGDGKAEVMVGNIYSTPLTVHNADGSFRWSTLEQVGAEGNATTPRRGIRLTEMVVQDINEDGVREIIYGTADGWLYAVSPVDGRECWRLNVVGEVTGLSAAGEHFYVSTEFGRMYGIDRYGAIVWSRTVSDQINGLALCGAHLVASDDTGLYRCDRSGNPSGSLTTPASVTGMVASGDRLYGVLGGTQLCRIHLMNFDDDIR